MSGGPSTEYAVAEIDRKLAQVVQIGRVTSVDPGAARVVVEVAGIPSPPIPFAQMAAGGKQFVWMPEVGEQVSVLAPGGELGQGVVLGAIFQGNASSSNPDEPHIELQGGNMTINGTLVVTGDVIAGGISLKTHTHGGVLPGGSHTGGPQ
ncbi:MAG: phage baseplate assembly protein V [Shimia sp.]